MACTSCGALPYLGNPVYGIPSKLGEPFSSAAERAYLIGSIPQVVRFPNFTLKNGGVLSNEISNGGIMNLSSFFRHRKGTYGNESGQISASNCNYTP